MKAREAFSYKRNGELVKKKRAILVGRELGFRKEEFRERANGGERRRFLKKKKKKKKKEKVEREKLRIERTGGE